MATRREVMGGLIAAGAGMALPPMLAFGASPYPSRTVHLIVPFTPGGGADTVSRLLAPQLQKLLGQPFVVENRAGAAGRIGTGVVAKSDPDGHTLLVSTESSLVIAPHIGVAIGYDPLKDFAPVSLLTRNTVVLVVHPSVPAKTLKEYMRWRARSQGNCSTPSSGVGGPNHLAGEIFNRMASLKITHVPYAGTGLALQSVLSNQVGAMWGFTAGLAAHIRQGTLRALAVGSKERSPALPDVPHGRGSTAYPVTRLYRGSGWWRRPAPPAPIVDKLWGGIDAALKEPSVRDIIVGGGSEIVCSKPEEFRQVIESDLVKYGKYADIFQEAK